MILNHDTMNTEEGLLVHVYPLIGDPVTMIFPNVTIEQMSEAYHEYHHGGKFIQEAYNFLNTEQREFLMTGLTPEKWDELFPEEDDD